MAVGYDPPMPGPTNDAAKGFLLRFASRLRFPQLFLLAAVLFAIDLVVPDVIPFADELLLGLLTLILGTWRDRRRTENGEPPAMKDVTPR